MTAERDGQATWPAWPHYSSDEVAAVADVLTSGRVNYWAGDQCDRFEREFSDYVGTRHAVALANGSVALETALRALGIGGGDQVVVTPRSFFASASCVALVGAEPVFVDVDRDSQNITAENIERAMTKYTKAIICVHHAGWPCEMKEIEQLARRRDLFLIEDCAQAHGARVHGRPVGSWGDIGVFSFCQDKIMSTGGEGGMLVTDDDRLWRAAWSFKDHGKNVDLARTPSAKPGFRWLHESFGNNYRMTEMQAAIGRVQLQKLDEWVVQRRRNAARLDEMLEQHAYCRVGMPPQYAYCSYYKYYFFADKDRMRPGWTRDRILAEFEINGIPGLTGSCPEIYRELAFVKSRYAVNEPLPVARELGESSIQLQVHPTLDDEHMSRLVDIVDSVLVRAGAT